MNLISVLVASVIGMMAVGFTFQGIQSAGQSQMLLKQKSDLVLESQGIGNVLQDPAACALSNGKQSIYYSNGVVAYAAGANGVNNFVWGSQGSATVLTIQPTNTMFKPIVLNLNCTPPVTTAAVTPPVTTPPTVTPPVATTAPPVTTPPTTTITSDSPGSTYDQGNSAGHQGCE